MLDDAWHCKVRLHPQTTEKAVKFPKKIPRKVKSGSS